MLYQLILPRKTVFCPPAITQLWDMIKTWGFCVDIKDTKDINDNDNNNDHDNKDDNNNNDNNDMDDNNNKSISALGHDSDLVFFRGYQGHQGHQRK